MGIRGEGEEEGGVCSGVRLDDDAGLWQVGTARPGRRLLRRIDGVPGDTGSK